MKKLSIFLTTLLISLQLSACTKPSPPAQIPGEASPTPTVTQTPGSSVSVQVPVTPSDLLPLLVHASACTKRSWPSRGVASSGYVEGVARSYQRTKCRITKDTAWDVGKIISESGGDTAADALAWYGIGRIPGLANASPQERVKQVYTLLIGLGMRESSGTYCTGRDTSASNFSAETCEAGAFQTSYNSAGVAQAPLSHLWADYKSSSDSCDFPVWSRGIDPKARANWNCLTPIGGTGTGAEWQKFVRSCPSFGADWAAVILRRKRSHYGPINRHEAEYNLDCKKLLDQVEQLPCL